MAMQDPVARDVMSFSVADCIIVAVLCTYIIRPAGR